MGHLKVALADSCPTMDWNPIWSRYQELYDEEAATIRARISAEDAEEAEDEAEDDAKDDGAKVEETCRSLKPWRPTLRSHPLALRLLYFSLIFVIRRMKVLGALDNPNGITSHSYNPSFVLKAVFHSSPSQILI